MEAVEVRDKQSVFWQGDAAVLECCVQPYGCCKDPQRVQLPAGCCTCCQNQEQGLCSVEAGRALARSRVSPPGFGEFLKG